jgi:3D (Asp-Asp-Asp) domain-containing protein
MFISLKTKFWLVFLFLTGSGILSLEYVRGKVILLSTTTTTADSTNQSILRKPEIKAVSDRIIEKDDNSVIWQTVRMRVTAYCPCRECCGKYSDGATTASGYRIRRGDAIVAADEKYSFGTKMIINGYNSGQAVVVRDRGGAIRENRLDVLFHSHKKALEWGVKYINVKVKISLTQM